MTNTVQSSLAYYQEQARLGLIHSDPEQINLLDKLQDTHRALCREQKRRLGVLRFFRRPKYVTGNYIWGGVGIGKSFVMDCFYHSLPFENKWRVHFHEFMRGVHARLKEHQGESNPLQTVARLIARKTMVICLDELMVTDIADAMILCRLFHALIDHGVCLVMTSNIKPDDLYKNGLQRISFLPAIDLIKRSTTVIAVKTTTDYRLRHLREAGVFHVPDDEIAEDDMEKCFSILTENAAVLNEPVKICGRHITIRKQAGDSIWFDFNKICLPPRSQHDYLAIAQQYKTVFISHIPKIEPSQNDIIILLIRMVDVFYDARIRLVCSAAVTAELIYTEGVLLSDFHRTRSRLLEMQSEHYFANS